jgi:hypothetical protein
MINIKQLPVNLMFVYYKGTVINLFLIGHLISALICGVKYKKHLKYIYRFTVESCVLHYL